MTEVGLGELSGSGLCGCKVAEDDEELVVYCTPIIQEGADDGLDSFDAGVVEFGAGVRQVSEFLFGAINNGYVAKGRVLRRSSRSLLETWITSLLLVLCSRGLFPNIHVPLSYERPSV